MSAEKFTPEQSLQLIRTMIEKVKQDVTENSFFLLLWGWLVFAAAILHYALMKFTSFAQPWLSWNLMWVGAAISIYYGIRKGRRQKTRTFLDDTMRLFGIGTGIMFTVLAFIMGAFEIWMYSFPIYFALYGYMTFVIGAIIRFPLLRWAAGCCWAIAIVSVFANFDIQLLLMALVVLISYIVPGYVLQSRQKTQMIKV